MVKPGSSTTTKAFPQPSITCHPCRPAPGKAASKHPDHPRSSSGQGRFRLMDAKLTYRQINDARTVLLFPSTHGREKGGSVGDHGTELPAIRIAAYAAWASAPLWCACNPLYVEREVRTLSRTRGETMVV